MGRARIALAAALPVRFSGTASRTQRQNLLGQRQVLHSSRAAANRAMDPPTPRRAAAAPRWLPPRHALPPGAAPVMMLPFGPPPGPGWLPMMPVVGTAPAPARGVVPAPAPAGWVPLPAPRGAAAPHAWLGAAPRRAAPRRPAPAGWVPTPRGARRAGRCPSCGRRAVRAARARGRRLTGGAARRDAARDAAARAAAARDPLRGPAQAHDRGAARDHPLARGEIVIPDPAALERNLSKYYKHSKYASFQRQLNNFGYRRRRRRQQAAETVYERQGASENLDDLLALRPVRPAPAKSAGATSRPPRRNSGGARRGGAARGLRRRGVAPRARGVVMVCSHGDGTVTLLLHVGRRYLAVVASELTLGANSYEGGRALGPTTRRRPRQSRAVPPPPPRTRIQRSRGPTQSRPWPRRVAPPPPPTPSRDAHKPARL